MTGNRSFLEFLTDDCPNGFVLAPEIQSLIRWLERHGQLYAYRRTNRPFLAIIPAPYMDDLTSLISFQPDPGMMRHWIGSDKADHIVIPIVRCGGDGSVMAVWRGTTVRYVFLGSEGDAFIVAQTAVDFILLITMGYRSIEGVDDLRISPEAQWRRDQDTPWPEPVALKSWVRDSFRAEYPQNGAALLRGRSSPDPFRQYLDGFLDRSP